MKNFHKTKSHKLGRVGLTFAYRFQQLLFILLLLLFFQSTIKAEGIKSIAPSTEDAAALFIGAGDTGSGGGDYGLFGWKDSNSKLFFNIQNTCEKVYIGFSIPKTSRTYSNTNPNTGGPGFTQDLIFRIIDPLGNPVNDLACFGNINFDGAIWQTLKMSDANITERRQADAGPNQLAAGGYDALELDLSGCGLTMAGNYSIEFFTTNQLYNPNTATSGFHIEFFDITVADCNNIGQTGRVWSNNWSLSIKADGDNAFDRAFNGAFYVCSEEGFITKIDFNSKTNNRIGEGKNNDQRSGFRAGSFNVSFNKTGPNNTGNILTDRLSVPDSNSPNPQFPVFLNLPDESICPEQPIGQLQQMKDFVTGCADSRCINFATTQLGQLDIILEKTGGNGAFDQPEEIRIAYEITEKDLVQNPETAEFVYQICVPWNGRDALGNMWEVNNLKISGFFRQGVYHFPSYDEEFNVDGFLVETVRPALGFQEIYYDDTAITEDNNTGESKDGSNGCVAPCHRWTGEWTNFDDKNLVYGNFNTINTWWFGNTVFQEFQVSQIAPLTLTCPTDVNLCFGESTDPSATGQPVAALLDSECIRVSYSDVMTAAVDCQGGQLIERTWASFLEGMESDQVSCIQRIKIAGQTPPNFSNIPADVTIACDEIPPVSSNIIAMSACGNTAVSVNFSESILSGACPNTSILRREWTATDACGNTGSSTQIITITDTEGPVFQGTLGDISLECDAPTPGASDLNLTDNCDNVTDISITYTDQILDDGGCSGDLTLIRTYTASDQCGNLTTANQRIIFRDNTPPVLNNIPADITVSCDGLTETPNNITATDNCDFGSNISIELREETLSGDCSGNQIIKRTWTATDGCGNSSTAQQLVFIQDNTAPILIGIPANITASCDNVPVTPTNISAQDNCSEVAIAFSEQSTNGLCAGSSSLTRTWTATDACGNVSTAQQLVTIIDTTPPQFSECGKRIKVTAAIDCQAANVPITPPTAMDNCSGATTVTSSVDLTKPFLIGVNSIIFTATDACGNTATCEYLIEVENLPFEEDLEDIEVTCNPTIDGSIVSWDPPNGNECCNSCSDETFMSGYTYLGMRGGHRYYLSDVQMDWHTARVSAERLGGTLAIINDPAENKYLSDLIPDDQSAFIGLTDVGREGSFYWFDGSPLLFTNWLSSQPNNKDGIQHYGQFLGDGRWNDAYVTNNFRALVEIVCADVRQVSGPLNGSKFEDGMTAVAYEVDYANCPNSDFSQFTVTVQNCPLRYCETGGKDATCFWIDRIQFADLDHSSGDDDGYADYTGFTANLTPGKKETMLLKPGFQGGHMFDLHWTVFIDYNRDGDFEDDGEFVLKKFENRIFHNKGDRPVFQSFTVPMDVTPGPTRMRVAMKFTENIDPCETFTFGEVQDYTVNILPVGSVSDAFQVNDRVVLADQFEEEGLAEEIRLELENSLTPEIEWGNVNGTVANGLDNLKVQLYPNPVRDGLSVRIDGFSTSNIAINGGSILKIYNHHGQIVHQKSLSRDEQQFLLIDVRSFTNGLYFLEVEDGRGERILEKFTKF